MKLPILFATSLFALSPALAQSSDGLMRPDTLTLELQMGIKAQKDELVELDTLSKDEKKAKPGKVLKKSVDHRGRKLHEITIDMDKKEVPDPVRLYIRVFQPEPFFDIYEGSITTGRTEDKLKELEGLSYRNGKFRLLIHDVPPGQYIVQVRMIGPKEQLYLLDQKITL